MVRKNAEYWRSLVATAATVEHNIVTQFSPRGFAEAMGDTGRWFSVRLGGLALTHDRGWVWVERKETLQERLRYAHKTSKAAFAALRAEIAPEEPACAAWSEAIMEKYD